MGEQSWVLLACLVHINWYSILLRLSLWIFIKDLEWHTGSHRWFCKESFDIKRKHEIPTYPIVFQTTSCLQWQGKSKKKKSITQRIITHYPYITYSYHSVLPLILTACTITYPFHSLQPLILTTLLGQRNVLCSAVIPAQILVDVQGGVEHSHHNVHGLLSANCGGGCSQGLKNKGWTHENHNFEESTITDCVCLGFFVLLGKILTSRHWEQGTKYASAEVHHIWTLLYMYYSKNRWCQ